MGDGEACWDWKSFSLIWLSPRSLGADWCFKEGFLSMHTHGAMWSLNGRGLWASHIQAGNCTHETSVFPTTIGLKCGSALKCFSMNICGKCLAQILSIQGRTPWLQAEIASLLSSLGVAEGCIYSVWLMILNVNVKAFVWNTLNLKKGNVDFVHWTIWTGSEGGGVWWGGAY